VLLNDQPLVFQNQVGGKDHFNRTQFGFVVSGPLAGRKHTQSLVSFDRERIRATRESHFAVPTVKQRGVYDSGDTGLIDPLAPVGSQRVLPASIPGNAIFSLYPFPNDPLGPYGKNTYTSVLPADGDSSRFSVKIDHQFEGNGKPRKNLDWKSFFLTGAYGDQLSGRYNFTSEGSILPMTGGALFSSLRPRVQTQNIAFFLNRNFSTNTSDTVRFSIGRTSLSFGEVRDPFLSPSSLLPNTPFLLNAPLLLNVTAPDPGGALNPPRYVSASSPQGAALLNSFGYPPITQTEAITGPLGQVVIPGFSPIGVDVSSFPQSRSNLTFQVADTITHIHGDHLFTFGFDVRKSLINDSLDKNFRPLAVFNGLRTPSTFFIDVGDLTRPNGVPVSPEILSGATLAAAGVPTGFFQTLTNAPDSSIGIRFTQFGFFFQDGWHLRPNLRVTAGLRYEFNNPPETVGERVENALDPAVLRARAEEAARFCNSSRCNDLVGAITSAFPADFKVSFGADRNDFDGRLGFAWNLDKSGRTVLRGGFGNYSGQFPGVVIDQSRNAFPSFLPLNLANFPAVKKGVPHSSWQTFLFNIANPNVSRLDPGPNIITPGTLNSTASINPIAVLVNAFFGVSRQVTPFPTIPGLDLVLPQKQLKTPSSLQSGITLEHQIHKDYLVSAAYVWTRGTKLLRIATPDLGLNRSSFPFISVDTGPQQTPFGGFPVFFGFVGPDQNKIVSQAFSIERTFFESSASSTYHSLQVEIRKSFSQGFQAASAFTYSHAIDDASDFFDLAGAFALPEDSVRRSEKASSNFDMRFRSVTHFIADVPWLHRWQLAGIVTAQSGQPFTVNTTFDVNQDGNLTDRLDNTNGLLIQPSPDRRIRLMLAPGTNPMNLLARDNQDGVVGRNSFRSPGLFTIDGSLTRLINLSEKEKVLLRLEVFNLLNHANFGTPIRFLEFPSFGSSVNTVAPARTIQFAIKYSF
jgi:hypothetical protein